MKESAFPGKIIIFTLAVCAVLFVVGTFVYINYLYDREVPMRSAKAIKLVKEYKNHRGRDAVNIIKEAEMVFEKTEPANFTWRARRKPFSYQMYEVILDYEVRGKPKECKWLVDTNKMESGDYNECARMITLLEGDKKE